MTTLYRGTSLCVLLVSTPVLYTWAAKTPLEALGFWLKLNVFTQHFQWNEVALCGWMHPTRL